MSNNATKNPKTQDTSSSQKLINTSVTQTKIPFSVVEAYKNIRTNLLTIIENTDDRILSFSSPNASEGKSTTAINVSIAISQLNKKVLLLDADTHRPTVHKKLKLSNETGYMNIITDNATVEDMVVAYNPYLDILTSGPSPQNPTELFSSQRFSDLLSELKEKYDYVIIDTPPLNLVSDALIVAQKCDGLLIVIRPGLTSHDSLKRSLSSLDVLKVNLLGVILNGSDSKIRKYYKYKSYSKYGSYNKYGY